MFVRPSPSPVFWREAIATVTVRGVCRCQATSSENSRKSVTGTGGRRRRNFLLGLPSAGMLLLGRVHLASAVTIKPELTPDFTSFDKTDPELRDVYFMIQGALNAESVAEEERRWTEVIEKYKFSEKDWAVDAVGRAYGNRGNSRLRQGMFEPAISDFNKSMEMCPYSVDPVLNRGVAFEGLKEYDRAIEDYQAVLDVSEADPAAWNNFANAHAALGHWDVAADAYERALALSNSFSFAAVNYATVLFQMGKDDQAIRQFRRILIKYPSFTDARAALAVALWVTGDRSGAETQWYRVEDSRYGDSQWLRDNRHWPPRLVKGMQDFRTISTV